MDPLTALVLVIILFGVPCIVCYTIRKGRSNPKELEYLSDRVNNLGMKVDAELHNQKNLAHRIQVIEQGRKNTDE
jgi:hypothetical protein